MGRLFQRSSNSSGPVGCEDPHVRPTGGAKSGWCQLLMTVFKRMIERVLPSRGHSGGAGGRISSRSAFAIALAGAIPVFDGDLALDFVKEQVAFGPRVPGSEAHDRTLSWISQKLEETGVEISKRPFILHNALTGDTVKCHNIIASFRPELKERIFFGAHWDSRAVSDMEPNPEDRMKPVPGANDGASGTAILLVLSRVLAENPPPIGVDLVFFDGEDQGLPGDPLSFCKGSQALAASISLTGFRPTYGLVIDLVGGKSVKYHPEKHSVEKAPLLMERILSIAETTLPGWVDRTRSVDIYDDHVPFLEAGIPCALLIGYGDPHWHTRSDIPRHCSARKMGGVGALLSHLVYEGATIK